MRNRRNGKNGISLGGLIALIILLNIFTNFGWLISLLFNAIPLIFVILLIRAIIKGSKSSEDKSSADPTGTKSTASTVRKTSTTQTAHRPEPKAEPVYPPEIQDVINEGKRAQKELARLYRSIPNLEVKAKIKELADITDKIVDDVKSDPGDLPQIKQFLDYYLPTTIKLLNVYDRMGAQGIQGENISSSMQNIEEMLDTAIAAYRKLLDGLFANQALDVETDIEVMNTLLRREGLAGNDGADFRKM